MDHRFVIIPDLFMTFISVNDLATNLAVHTQYPSTTVYHNCLQSPSTLGQFDFSISKFYLSIAIFASDISG